MLFHRWSIFFAILVGFCKYSAKMLRVVYSNTPRKLKGAMGYDPITGHGFGPKGRIEKLRQIVTSLIRHERLEGSFGYLDETRGYVELVSHSFYIIMGSLLTHRTCTHLCNTKAIQCHLKMVHMNKNSVYKLSATHTQLKKELENKIKGIKSRNKLSKWKLRMLHCNKTLEKVTITNSCNVLKKKK